MAFISLFLMFIRIGFFSFGGGYAMLPLIFQSIQEFGVMTSGEFARLVALSQVTPGPVAVNAATYVGYQYAGFGGAMAATIGVTLPSLALVLLTMHFMEKFKGSQTLDGILYGIRPATIGMVASAVIFIAENSIVKGAVPFSELGYQIKNYVNLIPFIIFVSVIVLAIKFNIGPIKLTILAGVVGALIIR